MKNLFIAFLTIVTFTVKGQITEGHVSYKIDCVSDNPDMQMAVTMLQGSTMEIYFTEGLTRSEMKMGTMMNISTLTDEKTGDLLMLMSGMIGKNAILTTLDEINKEKEETPEMEVTLVDETKVIMGYVCKKAIITAEDGSESVFWYTEDIKVAAKGQSYLNENVPGFPLEYEINNSGLKMVLTVTDIEKKIKKAGDLFDFKIPEGYKQMTIDQLKGMGM
jgi:GLPGLI family protein